jgi:Superinfection immunity protein
MEHLIIVLAVIALYLLPGIIGRKKRNAKAIWALDVLAGWTGVGWLVALIWALTNDRG